MAAANKASSREATPMMAQYLALKAEAPDALLLFRMGDFYELFLEDAGVAAAALDIALTHRGAHLGRPLPMCGVPVHSHEAYVARLVKAGHAVAIAEQVEDPAEARRRGAKSIVARAIVRVITPGTLTDERLLPARASNWLLAGFPAPADTGPRGGQGGIGPLAIGLAWADISTGELWLADVPPEALADELARIAPAEILWPEGEAAASVRPIVQPSGATPIARARFDSSSAARELAARLGVAGLEGFGELPRRALAALGGLLHHLGRTARGAPVLLRAPRLATAGSTLAIDAATRRSLDLGAGPAGLVETIDLTVTAAGARCLAADLAAPLTDRDAIEARLDLVQWLLGDRGLREAARASLRHAPDIARALGRIAAARATPRDLAALRTGLAIAAELGGLLDLSAAGGAPAALDPLRRGLEPPAALAARLQAALVENPPLKAADGGAIAPGYDRALDDARALAADSRSAIAALEAALQAETGIPQLRIRHNNVIGYHVEVPARFADLLAARDGFRHRQTMGGGVRFDTPALTDLAARIADAHGAALAAEARHLADLEAAVLAERAAIGRVAEALAALDRSAALAELAGRQGWTRPRLTGGTDFAVVGGRHPVVEAALRAKGAAFIPNHCRLEGEARVWLVTGPNMGGKSTFLRQNALMVVLAQAGSFVPAEAATLGLVDRLYSRVGASDNLAEGRSTFMVEMVETAAILNGATARSFLLLDEVGRGTATWDGLALAWAILEAIHDRIGARCLFASHYHELAALGSRLDGLALRTMAARQWQGDLVFLHEVADGAAPGSFGLDVARLAGVPADVLARAGEILGRLEQGDAGRGAREALSDLPLFATAPAPPPPADGLRARLAAIHPDSLSPRAALDLLYELKSLADEPH